MMKVIVALDSFKGTLSAVEACKIVSMALEELRPDVEVILKPMADGGEGTALAMMAARNGEWISKKVTGPLPDMEVDAGFVWFENNKTALVEMAIANGLPLLSKKEQNPLNTSTYGTGELIKAAIEYGARKILLAMGGSATVDGGVGAAMALGWQFLDEKGGAILDGGAALGQLSKIIKPRVLNLPPIEVLSDVDNPLCGRYGAAVTYGPQKGATPEMVEQLENNILRLSEIVKKQLNKDIKNIPGAGAAGGLAAGAIVFMDASVVLGIDTIMAQNNIFHELKDADWIITGEGSFDQQSLRGKVVSGIVKAASNTNAKVAVMAGQSFVPEDEYKKFGIAVVASCKNDDMSLDYALNNPHRCLASAARELIATFIK